MKQQLRPLAIIVQAPVTFVRCLCPTCLALDMRYPGEGYQLAFWPFAVAPAPKRLDIRNRTL